MAVKRKRQRIPKMGRHSSGQARVKLNGRVFYLGAHGSVEAQRRYTDLLNRWLDNGRKPLVETPVAIQVITMAERSLICSPLCSSQARSLQQSSTGRVA